MTQELCWHFKTNHQRKGNSMKIIKNTLLGIGAVSALAIAYAASEFDWHLGLMRENPVLFLKATLDAFIL